MSQVSLRPDPWLGSCLGCMAAHLLFAEGQHAAEEVAAALAPLEGQKCFVGASVPAQRLDVLAACTGAQMQLLDTNLRLERDMRQPFAPARVGEAQARDATPQDRDAVVHVAVVALSSRPCHRAGHGRCPEGGLGC